MANTPATLTLQAVLEDAKAQSAQWQSWIEQALRRAYGEGYRQGATETIDRMTRAAHNGVNATVPAIAGGAAAHQSTRKTPPRIGLGESSRGNYGVTIGLFRQALMAAPGTGLSKDDFIDFCHRAGADVTANQYKDVMKRLVGGEEAERIDGLYYPGQRLKPFVATPAQDNSSSEFNFDGGDKGH